MLVKILNEKLFEKTMRLRNRAKQTRVSMPKERKLGTLDRVFNEYLEFLKDEENETMTSREGRII